MKNIYKYIYITLGTSFLLTLTSCSDQELGGNNVRDAKYLECVTADYAYPDDGVIQSDPNTDTEEVVHDDNFEATTLLNDAIGEGSILYFSQLSNTLVPFTAEEWPIDAPETMIEKFGEENYPNLYEYHYEKKDYEAEWEDQPLGIGGYNFFPETPNKKMDWDDIKYWGLNNNGFSLFGLYFPYDNELNLTFKVEEDQSTLEALRKSNFIGAYHSSSQAYTRLRFRLFHLMAYLKVTLYVPVYNDDDRDKDGNKIRTGFPADALQSAQVLNVLTDFNINWYANRSSDTSPACSAISTGERSDINMYIPPLDSYENGLPPIVNIKTGEYYNQDDPLYNPDAVDQCWEITISVLIPAGQNYPDTKQDWTNGNILRFNMRQNIGEVPKRYVFNGSSAMNLIGGGDPLTISQGNIQHLNLYLPRNGAAAILLGATVEDWKQAYNDNMGLQKDPPLPSEPEEEN